MGIIWSYECVLCFTIEQECTRNRRRNIEIIHRYTGRQKWRRPLVWCTYICGTPYPFNTEKLSCVIGVKRVLAVPGRSLTVSCICHEYTTVDETDDFAQCVLRYHIIYDMYKFVDSRFNPCVIHTDIRTSVFSALEPGASLLRTFRGEKRGRDRRRRWVRVCAICIISLNDPDEFCFIYKLDSAFNALFLHVGFAQNTAVIIPIAVLNADETVHALITRVVYERTMWIYDKLFTQNDSTSVLKSSKWRYQVVVNWKSKKKKNWNNQNYVLKT